MSGLKKKCSKLLENNLKLRLEKLETFLIRREYCPFFLIVFLVVVFFWKFFVLNQVPLPADFVVGVYYPWLDYKWGYEVGVPVKNPITTDVVSFTYPMRSLAVGLLKKGEWPLWNPYILTGTPLLANFQSAPFSPTNFFYFIFDQATAWSFQVILQHILIASFTYLLLRHWKVSKISSLLGGIIFAFSGFNLIWSQWNAHALSASFIPLLLLFADKWLKEKREVNGAIVSFLFALQILSGYPQVVFYTLASLALLVIFRAKFTKDFFLRAALLGLFLVFGLGMVAFQLLPARELLANSQRSIESLEFSWAFLPWVKLITFIAPDFFGNHATGNYWGPTDYTTTTGFIGVVSMVLVGLGASLLKKRREVVFGLGLLVLSLVLAFPTPVAVWIWRSGIFGLQAASAHRSLVLFNLSASILAAFGADCFLKAEKLKYKRAFLFPILIILSYFLYAISLEGEVARGIVPSKVALRNLIFPAGILFLTAVVFFIFLKGKFLRKIGLIILVFLATFELFRFGWKFTPFSPRSIIFPTTPVLEYLVDQKQPFRATGYQTIPMNQMMPYGIETLEGYDAVYSIDVAQFIAAINSGKPDASPQGRYGSVSNPHSRLVDLANLKYLLVLKLNAKGDPDSEGQIPEQFIGGKYKPVFEDKTTVVLENKEALPRSFMVFDWEVIKERNKILERLLDDNFPLSEKIILEEDVNFPPTLTGAAKVNYEKYSEQESLIRVSTTNPGMLFVSDLYYPGWQVLVDGRLQKIYRANYTFRAVFVPEGNHEVRFVYHPTPFFNGLKVSELSFIGLILFTLAIKRVGKRGKRTYTSKD